MAQLTAMPGATVRPPPTPEQHLAADPESSVWVSASAGTGKTRVLSNRLLRLLLHGSDPASILCLTYTKAGAAEMARRVQADLADFAVMVPEALSAALANLLDRAPTDEETRRAKGGLLAVLDLPTGLRIMTIHSFCQSLLRRFPLEAGLSPHFELMEPRAATVLMREARDEVLIGDGRSLRQAIDQLAVALGERSLADGLAALDGKRAELTRLLAEHGGDIDALIATLYRTLDVELGMTTERLRAAACSDPDIDEPALAAAASALSGSKNENDQRRGSVVYNWLQADPTKRLQLVGDYEAVFLKSDRRAKAQRSVATKQVVEGHPAAWVALEAEQSRLLAAADREKAIAVAEKTAALLRVGLAIIQVFERRKRIEGKLDYTDLIDRSRALLEATDAGDWVRFKLDQRIDHLLIDESQDTSPDQWAIIEA
ncbi:MAG: UvrD-helicase domain-containing protein, partial [Geminicoccaceae bacterium]